MRLDDLRFFDPYSEIAHTENRLPHWQQPGALYFVTYRLADALPQSQLKQWEERRAAWLNHHPQPWAPEVEKEYHTTFSMQIEQWLDTGHGSCALRNPVCAEIVGKTLAHFEGARTTQLSWVVMPNHVHALFILHDPWPMESLIGSWKRYSAGEINRVVNHQGALWQRDYFDRLIRDENHFCNCVRYIRRNPEKARLNAGEYLLWQSDLAKGIE